MYLHLGQGRSTLPISQRVRPSLGHIRTYSPAPGRVWVSPSLSLSLSLFFFFFFFSESRKTPKPAATFFCMHLFFFTLAWLGMNCYGPHLRRRSSSLGTCAETWSKWSFRFERSSTHLYRYVITGGPTWLGALYTPHADRLTSSRSGSTCCSRIYGRSRSGRPSLAVSSLAKNEKDTEHRAVSQLSSPADCLLFCDSMGCNWPSEASWPSADGAGAGGGLREAPAGDAARYKKYIYIS